MLESYVAQHRAASRSIARPVEKLVLQWVRFTPCDRAAAKRKQFRVELTKHLHAMFMHIRIDERVSGCQLIEVKCDDDGAVGECVHTNARCTISRGDPTQKLCSDLATLLPYFVTFAWVDDTKVCSLAVYAVSCLIECRLDTHGSIPNEARLHDSVHAWSKEIDFCGDVESRQGTLHTDLEAMEDDAVAWMMGASAEPVKMVSMHAGLGCKRWEYDISQRAFTTHRCQGTAFKPMRHVLEAPLVRIGHIVQKLAATRKAKQFDTHLPFMEPQRNLVESSAVLLVLPDRHSVALHLEHLQCTQCRVVDLKLANQHSPEELIFADVVVVTLDTLSCIHLLYPPMNAGERSVWLTLRMPFSDTVANPFMVKWSSVVWCDLHRCVPYEQVLGALHGNAVFGVTDMLSSVSSSAMSHFVLGTHADTLEEHRFIGRATRASTHTWHWATLTVTSHVLSPPPRVNSSMPSREWIRKYARPCGTMQRVHVPRVFANKLLQQRRLRATHFMRQQLEKYRTQGEMCSICLHRETTCMTQCGHMFCSACIDMCQESLQPDETSVCAICRSSVHTIFTACPERDERIDTLIAICSRHATTGVVVYVHWHEMRTFVHLQLLSRTELEVTQSTSCFLEGGASVLLVSTLPVVPGKCAVFFHVPCHVNPLCDASWETTEYCSSLLRRAAHTYEEVHVLLSADSPEASLYVALQDKTLVLARVGA